MLITDDPSRAGGESRRRRRRRRTRRREAAYVAYVHRSRGVNIPEADIRTRFRYDGWREEASHAYQSISVEHAAVSSA